MTQQLEGKKNGICSFAHLFNNDNCRARFTVVISASDLLAIAQNYAVAESALVLWLPLQEKSPKERGIKY